MNFENYNKIYKEILDDEKDELSSNYLLNKYEIKHDEELLNILNQIKKNEYISSENKIINKLINELDENEDLLDINEIINIKEKVLDLSSIDLEDEIDTEEIIDNKTEKKPEDINKSTKKQNYYLYAIPFALILITAIYISNDEKPKETLEVSLTQEREVKKEVITKIEETPKKELIKKEIIRKIEKEEAKIETLPQIVEKTEEETSKENLEEKPKEIIAESKEKSIKEEILKKEVVKKEIISQIEKEEPKIEKIPQVVKKIEKKLIETDNTLVKSNSEEKLNKIEKTIDNTTNTEVVQIKLSSLDEINKYKNKLEYKNNKLFFEGKYYEEDNILFGFKIFKITPLYVKFEDVNKKIRKRFLINQ